MRPGPRSAESRLEQGPQRRDSFARLAVSDSTAVLGIVSIGAGMAGVFDDLGDAVFLLVGGTCALALGLFAIRTFDRRHRPSPARVLWGLTLSWVVLVGVGAIVYLATGTIDNGADALVESAAGFSATAVTTLDPSELTLPMQLWRAGTQWVGGLFGVIIAVVALPRALRGATLERGETTVERIAPTPILGRRRVLIVYTALTALIGLAYLAVGLGLRDSLVHAATTISTGGFSSRPDSFVGFGTGPRVVATVGMAIGGSSFALFWWVVRGRLTPLWRSTELRLYLALLGGGAVLLALDREEIGIGDALFTTTSAVSTTGYAAFDWTASGDFVATVLLLLIATGSMSGSAGGGLRVVRAWTLVGFARRELRRQLDLPAVVVVKQGGRAVEETTLERTTGYQIAHLGLCGIAAFLLAAAGVEMLGAIYTGISVLSAHGPGLGTGPFGRLDEFSTAARLVLLPFMLAARVTILPLLLAVSSLFAVERHATRQGRRVVRRLVKNR